MSENLKKTPLHAQHVEAGGRMVPFAGFEMPVQYSGVVDEHKAVRDAVGLFDVSHMGEVEFTGARALEVVNRIITNDLDKIADGQAAYTVMCNESGTIIDDLVVYRFSAERILICVNAANREKDFAWMEKQTNGDCEVKDVGDDYAQIAVQGPNAEALVARLTSTDVTAIGRYRFAVGKVVDVDAIIARTGYTGEDGFELYVASADAPKVWNALLEKGADLGVKPAGLGARDSLRLEVCYPLYGNDIDETTNPYEAGLGWVVKLKKAGDFVGKAALEQVKADGPKKKLVGVQLVGRGIARQHYPVLVGGEKVGEVTSGTMGPTVEKPVALAYVPAEHSAVGTDIQVEVRNKPIDAKVAKKPFLQK
ncbi:MAG: glycine cleavage system aminomethyltransferase GcvT [Deltaproteobacteria bacterium]